MVEISDKELAKIIRLKWMRIFGLCDEEIKPYLDDDKIKIIDEMKEFIACCQNNRRCPHCGSVLKNEIVALTCECGYVLASG